MTAATSRIAYRAILSLHPSAFHAEFGDEMLWVFDEEMREGAVHGKSFQIGLLIRLLTDGLRSAAVQHVARPRPHPQPEPIGPNFREVEPAVRLVRFAEAGFVALSCLVCIFSVSVVARMVAPELAKQKRQLDAPVRAFSTIATSSPQGPTH